MTDNPNAPRIELNLYEHPDCRRERRLLTVMLIVACLVALTALTHEVVILGILAGVIGGWSIRGLLNLDYIGLLEEDAYFAQMDIATLRVSNQLLREQLENNSVGGRHGIN